jgi:GGDEF domain-containing protein
MVFRDVSAARAITAKLVYQAQHDGLTGLPNRALLDSRVAHAIALARRSIRPLAVLFVDMDDFKYVNDTLRHPERNPAPAITFDTACRCPPRFPARIPQSCSAVG